jgi:DNA polymerase elongation subunit (family B)
MNCALCVTLEDAIRAFLSAGYPLPVRALARRFGICDAKVRRLARRLATEPVSNNQLSEQPTTVETEEWLASLSAPDFPTLSEPLCPACGEPLEPEADGTAACVGCGRLYKVKKRDEDGDDDDGDGGGNVGDLISAPKLTLQPATQVQRMTARQPDGSIVLEWRGKTEVVAPDDLKDWQPIETLPEVDLPDISTVEIPPTIVLDLETTDLDPAKGRILAAGLALFVKVKEVEAQIIRSDDGEANLLAQVFGWLRETYDSLGEFILTGYNMFDFDLSFLIERSRRLGIKRYCPFDYERDKDGKIKWRSIPDTQGKYTYKSVVSKLPILLIDTQHLVIRNDMFEKVLLDYRLKSVAEHFGVNIPNRPILTHKEIVHDFYHNRPKFDAYLLADLRETYNLFDLLIKSYAGIASYARLDLEDIARKQGRGWIWEQHYERYYGEKPQADKPRKFVGGLVVSRKGLWRNCAKFDIASLYPTIILAYRIHSRKDPDQIGLRYLKTYTKERLLLKLLAKETGDKIAKIKQESMKVLVNSHFGFFGSTYPFNDIDAAEKVTKTGRKILTCMIAAIEDTGGIVVEADTDGIIVSCQDKDPQKIWQAISAAIPPVFKVEMEWQGMTVFVSEDKNYIVLDANGDIVTVKGSKWRGRDKPAFQTKAIPEFVRIWASQGKEVALDYAKQVLAEIRSGQGWHWVVRTHRVGKGDKSLFKARFKVGEIATYAYKLKTNRHSEIAKSPEEGYDSDYYAKEFSKLVVEVIEAIDPAQIGAWREIVASEACLSIFRQINC